MLQKNGKNNSCQSSLRKIEKYFNFYLDRLKFFY